MCTLYVFGSSSFICSHFSPAPTRAPPSLEIPFPQLLVWMLFSAQSLIRAICEPEFGTVGALCSHQWVLSFPFSQNLLSTDEQYVIVGLDESPPPTLGPLGGPHFCVPGTSTQGFYGFMVAMSMPSPEAGILQPLPSLWLLPWWGGRRGGTNLCFFSDRK